MCDRMMNNQPSLSFGKPISLSVTCSDTISPTLMVQHYSTATLSQIMQTAWHHVLSHILPTQTHQPDQQTDLTLPYYPSVDWHQFVADGGRQITIDCYITDADEARKLNQQGRGKDYATNILSYPSDLPEAVQGLMDELPLGELVLCHQIISQQAQEQNKTIDAHLAHLLVHGLLHLLGFDHELGQFEQEQMEKLEIDILACLEIANPYL